MSRLAATATSSFRKFSEASGDQPRLPTCFVRILRGLAQTNASFSYCIVNSSITDAVRKTSTRVHGARHPAYLKLPESTHPRQNLQIRSPTKFKPGLSQTQSFCLPLTRSQIVLSQHAYLQASTFTVSKHREG